MVRFTSAQGGLHFEDTEEHFENAVLRLAIDRASFQPWLDAAGRAGGTLEERLARGFAEVAPERARRDRIAESPRYALHLDGDFGWLTDGAGARVTEPARYEEQYFEGGEAAGYGHYLAQAGWRLQKAARQVRELREATRLEGGRVLDVGSGYGFFRKALFDAGFEHAGVEISAHARGVAKALYGFETAAGPRLGGGYDALTLWDVVEHVADPVRLLREAAGAARFVALKTPNLDCPEARIFGGAYHSLKREHLVYFTPASLTRAAREAGLEPLRVSTVSHLLGGFFGPAELRRWEAAGQGADLIAYFRRAAG